MRKYGEGRVFPRGRKFWIAYCVDGSEVREAAGKTEEAAAKKLKARMKDAGRDDFLGPREEHVTVSEILDDYLVKMANAGRKSIKKMKSHLEAVRAFFGSLRAVRVTTAQVENYKKDRLAEDKARATVNRELEGLRSAYRWAAAQTPRKIHPSRVPMIPMLKVDNARQGFLSRADFEAVSANIGDADVRDFIAWSFWTSMRPNETRSLTWAGFNAEDWTLTLSSKDAKISKGRVIALAGPVREIIERRLLAQRFDTPLIFHRTSKGKTGRPVKDIRLAWATACEAAGLAAGRKVDGGVTPYDLRRTGLRNMVRGGTGEAVAMKISGHRTRSTFDRYNIVDADDIRAAMEKTAAYVSTLPTKHSDNIRTDSPSRSPKSVFPSEMLAEAGGNRTHRCRG